MTALVRVLIGKDTRRNADVHLYVVNDRYYCQSQGKYEIFEDFRGCRGEQYSALVDGYSALTPPFLCRKGLAKSQASRLIRSTEELS